MALVPISNLKARGTLSWGDLDGLIQALSRCMSSSSRLFNLDLSAVHFCDPASLVILAAGMKHLHLQGCRRLELLRPQNEDVDRYLDRMGFYEFLDGQRLLDIRRFSGAGRFLELVQLTRIEECSGTAEKVAQVFRRSFGMSDEETQMVIFVITEILENIFNHASSSIGGLICCQTYPTKRLVRIGITDLGIGIEQSLRENPANLERLKHANPIEVAVEKKVTGRPANFGGYGLFLASKIIRENEGVFGIRSRRHGWTQVRGRIQAKHGLDWPGTALNLIFRTNNPISLAKLFDDLTEAYNLDDLF
jgi:anti-sigma regulatory factor (Ser/Thr protein kinase)/anti-anti-sigma regulatory factor